MNTSFFKNPAHFFYQHLENPFKTGLELASTESIAFEIYQVDFSPFSKTGLPHTITARAMVDQRQ
jgi:hypothetical protein